MGVKRGSLEEQKKRCSDLANIVTMLTCICWRAALKACFWISIDIQGIHEIRGSLGTTSRPVCVVANHTSFLDIFLCVTSMPLRKVGEGKMIVSSHVLKMPILGRLATTMGHLAVPFKDTSATSTNFEIDKEGLAKVMEEYEQHLKDGHLCAWFPEGQVNKGDCSKLQQFRAGGLGIAVRTDVELWCLAFVGNAVCWPNFAPLGGYPAQISGKAFQVCESSKALLASEESGKDERDKCIYLATLTQTKIQEFVDGMVAQGVRAGDNTRRKKEDSDDSSKKK